MSLHPQFTYEIKVVVAAFQEFIWLIFTLKQADVKTTAISHVLNQVQDLYPWGTLALSQKQDLRKRA
jgi:hypothetical protein